MDDVKVTDVSEIVEKETVDTEIVETKTYTQEELEAKLEEVKFEHKKMLEEQVASAIAEEKRLSKMSAEEKREEEHAKLLKEIEELKREKENSRLEKVAIEELSKMNLDTSFADFVKSDDESNIVEKVQKLKNVFDAALEKTVIERLKGETPKIANTSTPTTEVEDKIDKILGI